MSPNRLAAQASPYLRQHADNPVEWYPWGPEAFAQARRREVPILLSIGYSTCHWCHVMERESFRDPATAAVMNEGFVCVKLDREERPDVDRLYMTAVQAMTGSGGWPLNVFLTPELKPFYGGTYFPPEPRWGRPSWVELLRRLSRLWRERRGEAEDDARRLAQAVSAHLSGGSERDESVDAAEALRRADAAFAGAYDPDAGGFGGAPKFPMPAFQRYLLRRSARTGAPRPREMALATLRAMVRGGIFDRLGGGFHRYSTDAQWRVPHFEKMLYDNAQLLENLADAVQATRDPELSRALEQTVDYLARDLRAADGGLCCAEDADSAPAEGGEKREGEFYLWTAAELRAALGPAADAFCRRHGVEAEGNAIDDPHGELAGRNVLIENAPEALGEDADRAALATLKELRARRPRPSRDDKRLACWNGLALSGLSRAHVATGSPRALELAQETASFLRRELASADGRELKRCRAGENRTIPGMADDYAFVAAGLLDLYEADFDAQHLRWALTLTEEALRRFAAPGGGLYQTADGAAPELWSRALDDDDGVEPSASAVLADACLRLHALTGREDLRRFADKTLARGMAAAADRPLSRAHLLSVLDRAGRPPTLVLVTGLGSPAAGALMAAARSRLRPDALIVAWDAARREQLARMIPAVAAIAESPDARAYACVGGACGLPVDDPRNLEARLDGLAGAA